MASSDAHVLLGRFHRSTVLHYERACMMISRDQHGVCCNLAKRQNCLVEEPEFNKLSVLQERCLEWVNSTRSLQLQGLNSWDENIRYNPDHGSVVRSGWSSISLAMSGHGSPSAAKPLELKKELCRSRCVDGAYLIPCCRSAAPSSPTRSRFGPLSIAFHGVRSESQFTQPS